MLSVIFTAVLVFAVTPSRAEPKDYYVRYTNLGPVQGEESSVTPDVDEYRGIPYGRPTGGARRFKNPEIAESWTEVLESAPSKACIQDTYFTDIDGATQSEDCLQLDVYTPSNTKPVKKPGKGKPVIVWIHGGRFMFGWNGAYHLRQSLALVAKSGAIVVAINYRLGALGWLWLSVLFFSFVYLLSPLSPLEGTYVVGLSSFLLRERKGGKFTRHTHARKALTCFSSGIYGRVEHGVLRTFLFPFLYIVPFLYL